jgi:hypothetical protein
MQGKNNSSSSFSLAEPLTENFCPEGAVGVQIGKNYLKPQKSQFNKLQIEI